MVMEIGETIYVHRRADWRRWLRAHFQTKAEIWLVLPHKNSDKGVADLIERRASDEEQSGFDIDPALDADLAIRECTPSPVTLDDLDRVIADPSLMPPGTEVRPMGPREYSLLAPGMQQPIRVTTDEYWSGPTARLRIGSSGRPPPAGQGGARAGR